MIQAGYLEPEKYPIEAIYRHWGLFQMIPEKVKDMPVVPDFRSFANKDLDAQFGFFYTKTFKIQYLLYKELGPENYREFLIWLNGRKYSDSGTDLIPAKLKEMKSIDWKEFLSGWVYAGKYHKISFGNFGDTDRDGLIDVDEMYGGSDYQNPDTDSDMIPDGAELRLGTDPLKADPLSTVKKYAPFADGLPYEWKYVTSLKHYDAVGDGDKKTGFDFTELQYTLRGNVLYVAVQNMHAFTPKDNYLFDILIDTDFDGKTDYEAAFMTPAPMMNWIYRDGPKNSFNPTNLQCAWNNYKLSDGKTVSCFEMKISLDEIGSPKALQILPIIRDTVASKNFDEWNGWVEILKFDAGDSFNAIIDRYGVLINGVDDEWEYIQHISYKDEDASPVSQQPFDLRECSITAKDGSLYLSAKTASTAFPIRDVYFIVRIDKDSDGQADMEASTSLKSPGYPWVYFYSLKNWKTVPGQKAGWNDCIEMVIPCKELGLPAKFKIQPIFWDNEKIKILDEWSEWIEVTVK